MPPVTKDSNNFFEPHNEHTKVVYSQKNAKENPENGTMRGLQN